MNTSKPEGIGLVKFSFYLFGIGGLVAWNAILSIMDFFIHFQGEYSPQFTYPNMNFVLNVVFQLIYIFTRKRFSHKSQILFSFTISVISMLTLPIAVIFIKGSAGFAVTCFIILLQGLANAIILSNLYAITSFLPFEFIIAFSTGQGLAGIIMNVTRYIILASFGGSGKEINIILGSLIFFSISALILALCIVFLLLVYKNPYFISQMKSSGEFPPEIYPDYAALTDEKLNDFNDDSTAKTNEKSSTASLMHLLLDLNFIIFLNYVVTFGVFPGVTIMPGLFGMTDGYRINTIIMIFNVFDTIGRNFPEVFRLSRKSFYLLAFSRIIFFFTFVLIIALQNTYLMGTTALGILVCVNMILFAFSNGYVTSTSFSLAPEQVPKELVGKSGSTISVFLIIGIFSGTLFATFIMQNLF